MQISNSSPLLIEDRDTVANTRIKRGRRHRRRLTICYIGKQPESSVNFWLESPDSQVEELLMSCCRFDHSPPLKQVGREPQELTLIFDIPPQMPPGLYNYSVVFESVQEPGQLVRRPLQLQVMPAEDDAALEMEPRFTITPMTTADQPYELNPEAALTVTVKVENRSKLVDRFYLTCPALDQSWFTVKYPESAVESLGLVQEADGLRLLPKDTGEITVLLHPPKYTRTGNYFPVLQLTSQNNPDSPLLDVLYLQVQPDERLTATLKPDLCHIPQDPAQFAVTLTNLGNMKRCITVNARDRDRLFTYQTRPALVELDPGDVVQIDLKPKPRQRWKRPWRGKGIEIPFDLELENALNYPTAPALADAIALPEALPQGTLIWQARHWSLRWLLMLIPLLALLGLLGAAVLFWLTRPIPLKPEILAFGPSPLSTANEPQQPSLIDQERKTGSVWFIWSVANMLGFSPPPIRDQPKILRPIYQEGKTGPIRLAWKVTNMQKIDHITVMRLEKGVETYRKTYYFDGKLQDPLKLKPDPAIPDRLKQGCELTPQTIKTGTKLEMVPGSIFGLPFSHPKLSDRQENTTTVTCQGMLTPTQKAGDYTFQMQVFAVPESGQPLAKDPIATRTTDTIAIKPDDTPQILSFAPTQSLYQEVASSTSPNPQTPVIRPTSPSPQAAATSPTSPNPQVSVVSPTLPNPQAAASGLVQLNWQIANPSRIEELRVVSLSADGSAEGETKTYRVVNGAIPELVNLCPPTAGKLICQNVPTGIRKPGNYVFKLIAVVKQDQGKTELVRNTEPVKIQPLPLEIKAFTVNGQSSSQKPKHLYLLGQVGDSLDIAVAWEVSGGEDMQVELSPSPGAVGMKGNITFTLNAPSAETITLKVSNKFGDQKSQSVTVQASAGQEPPPAPIIISPPPAPGSANEGDKTDAGKAAPLTPSVPDRLSPIEVPPRPN
jgi:hypothetical protein